MATKKQKRAAAEAKHAEYMAKYRADGLAALKADQERRKKLSGLYAIEARKINDHHRRVLERNGLVAERQSPRVLEDYVERDIANTAELHRIIQKDLLEWTDEELGLMEADQEQRELDHLSQPFSHLTKSGT